MSDISVSSNILTNNTGNISNTKAPQAASQTNSANKTADVQKDSAKDLQTEEYGPVVSSSSDGDTLRVKDATFSESTSTESDESSEYDIANFDTKTLEETVDEIIEENEKSSDTETNQEITSYVGYTDSELKQLYLKGEISQIDYNLEMQSREEQRESQSSNEAEFADTMAKSISNISSMDRAKKSIEAIESDNVSSTIPTDLRMDALQNFSIEG